MVIIICGLDRCGKSTQIEKIRNYFSEKNIETNVIHYEQVNTTKEHQEAASRIRYDDMLKTANELSKNKSVMIYDRAHLGEYVYSPIYRNYSGEYVFELEKKYETVMDKAILFLFTDRPENLLSREDGLSFSSKIENKQKEIILFTEAFNKSNIKHKYHIDIDGLDENKVWEIVKSKIEENDD